MIDLKEMFEEFKKEREGVAELLGSKAGEHIIEFNKRIMEHQNFMLDSIKMLSKKVETLENVNEVLSQDLLKLRERLEKVEKKNEK